MRNDKTPFPTTTGLGAHFGDVAPVTQDSVVAGVVATAIPARIRLSEDAPTTRASIDPNADEVPNPSIAARGHAPRQDERQSRVTQEYPTMTLRRIALAFAALALVAPAPVAGADTPERWYDQSRIDSGGKVYAANCAVCHGVRGEAAPDWRRREPDGSFPPPPLNGTAHTWHHPFGILARQIKFGAPGGGGKMPLFRGKLTDEEIINVIAWFQSLWPDDIYAQWWAIQRQSSQ